MAIPVDLGRAARCHEPGHVPRRPSSSGPNQLEQTGTGFCGRPIPSRVPESLPEASTSVAADVGDPDLADLAEEVTFPEVIETATVAGIAGESRTHAELGVVIAVVHEFPPVGTMHLPDQTSVEEQFVQVLDVVVLPGDVMPLGVVDAGVSSIADDAPWTLPRIQVCLLYTSPSPRDLSTSRMPSSA